MVQLLGGGEASELAPKLRHLGLADILFVTMIMCLPKEQRPLGIVTWIVGVFLLSRPSLYALTRRTQERLLVIDIHPQQHGRVGEDDDGPTSRNTFAGLVRCLSCPL